MSARQIVGAAMLAAPLVAVLIGSVFAIGIVPTVAIWLGLAAFVAWLRVAAELLEPDE